MEDREAGTMTPIFTSQDVKAIDRAVMDKHEISSFELMKMAGAAIFKYVQKYQKLLIVTGAGNNAGDGFVIATLAIKEKINVTVWSLVSPHDLPQDAKKAAEEFSSAGGAVVQDLPDQDYDCIVDAVFGSGLSRDIEGRFAEAIHAMNSLHGLKLAVDISSGLHSDTGQIMGVAFQADITIAVICHKVGYHTNHGKDLSGKLFLESLGWSDEDSMTFDPQIFLLNESVLHHPLMKHPHNSHKGSFGSVVIAGGHQGMLGAVILAGKSALVSGCGLVEVVTNNTQSVLISLHCPELLTASSIDESRVTFQADVIAVGPGLGIVKDSFQVLEKCISLNKPMVLDADALTLISMHEMKLNDNCVITPHPKEAARLLNCMTHDVLSDRVQAARDLCSKYNCVVILKGSGSIVASPNGQIFINPYGYSGMATAGMGDVLTGIVASLMAQGLNGFEAAKTSVVWHALAAESANKGNCLIASDVIDQLAQVIL